MNKMQLFHSQWIFFYNIVLNFLNTCKLPSSDMLTCMPPRVGVALNEARVHAHAQ